MKSTATLYEGKTICGQSPTSVVWMHFVGWFCGFSKAARLSQSSPALCGPPDPGLNQSFSGSSHAQTHEHISDSPLASCVSFYQALLLTPTSLSAPLHHSHKSVHSTGNDLWWMDFSLRGLCVPSTGLLCPGIKLVFCFLFCFFFRIGELNFSNGLWKSVGGDGRDLHSVFFSGFKSFLKIFNFHQNAAQNLGTARHLAVQPPNSAHSTKCVCNVWLRGLVSHSGDLHRARFLPLMTSRHLLLSALWPVLF